MPRPKTKTELLQAASSNFDQLFELINSMSETTLNTEFDFSADKGKTEQHWSRDKNLRDVLVHLYEWHQLLIKWISANSAGNKVKFLPAPYTWKNYADMNREIWKKHQTTTLDNAQAMLQQSHQQCIDLIEDFSDEVLFTKKYFDWTGTTSVGSYCISATSSHYDWAIKKLKAHIRNCKR
ncbi:ClbS/DfsB family four-helix bundle protein [Bacterioplanoides sp. SCSIO 12839]|uniref:ClbS/DfsB family four-helix bundle protein n=1 Tax=Bacterioplanoides sp. SCSIO 12839 TaxID=2829569 RepID=UPI0021074EF3|nr:ClbS/DfsB family four-helix bundle protein [Bacterioplanoides sp. SCSIO 12839]UTW47122.1 ClbS/DfsB family four-helix bundle protein [Bacterioplanoides sp. SCSIO 12839]